MSAIAGFVQFDGTAAVHADLSRMLDVIAAYRRVDVRSDWYAGPAALGHLLTLHTPEDALERQPLRSADGRFVLSGDLRLDNRTELANQLGLGADELRGMSDGDLVLAAWETWREACPPRLLGDFAFAVWDALGQRLFCARDHLGVRPLYYAKSSGRFAVASAIKGLLALDGVSRQLDEEALADYLVALDGDLDRTIYAAVRRLPAGHTLAIDARGRVEIRRYWAPDPDFELRLGSDEEYAERLRELLREAVVCRMRGAPSTGILLSGGLDSSMLACLAADSVAIPGQRVVAVASALPENHEGPETDEWTYISAVAQSRSNIDVCRVTAPGAGLLTGLDEALAINDEPFRDIFHYMTRALLLAAREAGAENLLWGFGGDHVVSSWADGYLAELCSRGRLFALVGELVQRKRRWGLPVTRQLRRGVVSPFLPGWLVSYRAARRGKAVEADLQHSAIAPLLAARTGVVERWQRARVLWREPRTVRAGDIRAISARSLTDGLEYAAHLADSLGVRLHTPLIDKRVIEFALAMPAGQKAGDGWTRLALRRAMAGVVPDTVRWRRDKGAFSPDFDRRVGRDRDAILALIGDLERDPWRGALIDGSRMRRVMTAQADPQTAQGRQAENLLAIGAGVVAARFLPTSSSDASSVAKGSATELTVSPLA